MIATILVGGKRSLANELIPVNGQPFLYWLTLWLKKQGLKHIVYSAGHHIDEIYEWVNQIADSEPDLCLDIVSESRPLGTAGAAALCAKRFPSSHTLVVNGDSILLTPIAPQFKKLKNKQNLDGIIFGTNVPNAGRFGALETNIQHQLITFKEKQPSKHAVNAGVYLLRHELFDEISADKESSLEYDCFPRWLQEGKLFEVVEDGAPFIDIGTSETLKRANELLEQHQSFIEETEESYAF